MAQRVEVTGGGDTHKDTHTVAAVDDVGRMLGSATVTASGSGYRALLRWLRAQGRPVRVGVEGTGVYGAGLTRFLAERGVEVVEVTRPDRVARRRAGKSDPVDAEAAARAALAAVRTALPKQRDGRVESLRMLRIARRSAVTERADALRQMHTLVVTAPEPLRAALRDLPARRLVAVCA